MFIGSLIRALARDQAFAGKMNDKERGTWLSCVVMENFLGNKKAENCEIIVATLLLALYNLGCSKSVKPYFLHNHIDRFPDNLEVVSDEEGDRF